VQGNVVGHARGAADLVAYRGNRDAADVFELYEASTDGTAARGGGNRILSPPLGPNETVSAGPRLAGAVDAVLYEVRRASPAPREVWVTPFGGAPRLLFDLETIDSDYLLVEPGRVVIYRDAGLLRELDIDTGATRSLDASGLIAQEFHLSRDRSTLIVRANSDLWSLPAAGGTPTRLRGGGAFVAVSPGGQWVLAREGAGNFTLAPADGGLETDLGFLSRLPRFTADGLNVIYRSATAELSSYDIAADQHVRIDGGVAEPGQFIEDWWTLPGSDLIFGVTDDSSFERGLFRVSAAGGPVLPVFDGQVNGRQIYDVLPSPDGKHIVAAVGSTTLGPRTLFIAPSTGGGVTRPLPRSEGAGALGFTPDSRALLYQGQNTDYTAPLRYVTVNGSGSAQLTPEGFGDVVAPITFGADGVLVFEVEQHRERRELYTLDLDDFVLFVDGFESGDTSRWSLSEP
ncbi:MAG: hypothetical protein AAFY88_08355, partial [Acidobacteriota bacterium]